MSTHPRHPEFAKPGSVRPWFHPPPVREAKLTPCWASVFGDVSPGFPFLCCLTVAGYGWHGISSARFVVDGLATPISEPCGCCALVCWCLQEVSGDCELVVCEAGGSAIRLHRQGQATRR